MWSYTRTRSLLPYCSTAPHCLHRPRPVKNFLFLARLRYPTAVLESPRLDNCVTTRRKTSEPNSHQEYREMDTRILPITSALWILAARAEIYFVNPPRFGTTGDFSSNAVYTIGQNLRVQWSEAPENTGISVLLYQLNNTEYMLPGQYLFRTNFTLAVCIMLPHCRPLDGCTYN